MMCLLGLTQAMGATAFVQGACAESCPDDDAEGNCPPSCVCCTCCVHATPFVAVVAATDGPQSSVPLRFPHDEIEPSSTTPRDILHVPKSRLA